MGQNEESGKEKGHKLEQHFTSASDKLSAEKFHSFNKKEIAIDVALSNARMQKMAIEEQECLNTRKVIALLLDCCHCFERHLKYRISRQR